MKNKVFPGLVICLFAANFSVSGQTLSTSDSVSNYVVIGAFKVEKHAPVRVKEAKAQGLTAVYALNLNRNLYYVWILKTEDRPKAFEEAARMRKDSPFWDTWVYRGSFNLQPGGQDLDAVTHQPITISSSKDPGGKNGTGNSISGNSITGQGNAAATPSGGSKPVNANQGGSNQATNSAPGISGGTSLTGTSAGNTTSGTNTAVSGSVDSKQADIAAAQATKDSLKAIIPVVDNNTNRAEAGAKIFLFKIEAAEAKTQLIGKVDVIDGDKARKFGSYAGNKPVMVNPPSKSGNMSLICQVFGYRKSQWNMNFFHPSDSGGVVIDTAMVTVPFELVRLQKGDFAVMYNVYFFKDAAVMRPESKYEVTSLLNMMNENPKYKIRIHGHTNGSASGKVTSMGDSKNYFSLNGTSEGFGSAKKLSEERAKMMRQYLVDNGIDMKRMEIKAWGGKKPVYDKMSPQAQANVRVEIEILEDK